MRFPLYSLGNPEFCKTMNPSWISTELHLSVPNFHQLPWDSLRNPCHGISLNSWREVFLPSGRLETVCFQLSSPSFLLMVSTNISHAHSPDQPLSIRSHPLFWEMGSKYSLSTQWCHKLCEITQIQFLEVGVYWLSPWRLNTMPQYKVSKDERQDSHLGLSVLQTFLTIEIKDGKVLGEYINLP